MHYTQNDLQQMYEKPSQELTDRIHQTITSFPPQEQEEIIVKKKLPFSVVCVFVILFALAAAAYAASTGWVREVTWQGETVETTDEPYTGPEMTDDFTKTQQFFEEQVASIPDDEYADIAYYGNGFNICQTRQKQKVFTSFEEFKQYMAGVDYLTVPAWLPENMTGFSATVYMDSKPLEVTEDNKCILYEEDLGNIKLPEGYTLSEDENGKKMVELPEGYSFAQDETSEWISLPGDCELIEETVKQGVRISRYALDDAHAVVTGYGITISIEGHHDIEIDSELGTYVGDMGFWLQEGETATPLNMEGVEKALLVASEDPELKDKLFLHKDLDKPVTFVRDMDDMRTSSMEDITVIFYDQAPETVIKIMTGK